MNAVRRPMDFALAETDREPNSFVPTVTVHGYDSPRQAELFARIMKRDEEAFRELAK